MRHEAVTARLSDYLEGSLSGRAASRMATHLAGCSACRCALLELQRTVGLLHGLRGVVESPDLEDVVLARIRAGEGEPTLPDRLWAGASRFLSTPLGAPLATAAVGLVLLAALPRIEVEVSIPGRSASTAAALAPVPPATARAPERSRASNAPLLARRVNESVLRESSRFVGRRPFACLESSPLDVCREHHAFMTKLAMENVWAFVAEVEELPEPGRDDWLAEISRFAAESGAASDVAARLRATGDPHAQRMAVHFERAR